MATTGTTGTTTSSRACCGGFTFKGRVDTGLNRGLQTFDIGQIAITGRSRGRIGGLGLRIRPVGQHLLVEGQTAVTTQGQLLPVGHGNRNGASCSSNNLLTGKYAVTFDQRSPRPVARYCIDFADDLTDDTN